MNSSTIPPYTSRKVKLLVVEDNADVWFMIRWALLQRFPEAEAVWSQDAAQAMQYLEDCANSVLSLPKIILMDLYLPTRTQGWSLLQTIKTHHLFREIPVVMLSQSDDPIDISESYNLRINSYILKPIGYDKWLDCIASFRHYWWDSVTLPSYL